MTDHDNTGWAATAYYVGRSFIKKQQGTFTAEQLRAFAYEKGLPVPHDERAWGGVLTSLAREGYIRKCGYVQATGSACHMHPVTNWKVAA